jgi:hypothetical protein
VSKQDKRGEILHYGPWQLPYKAINVMCDDGIRRTCKTGQEADTFFSLPASCQAYGKTIAGFIMSYTAEDGARDLRFCAYQYCKNGAAIPVKVDWNRILYGIE